jgi:hypothetical protein
MPVPWARVDSERKCITVVERFVRMIAKNYKATVPRKLLQTFRGQNAAAMMSHPGPNCSMPWLQHRVRSGLRDRWIEGL